MIPGTAIAEGQKETGLILFIIAAELWSTIFVWAGPNMGIFSDGSSLDMRLQNVFILIFSIGAIVFTFICRRINFGIITLWGSLGVVAALITFFLSDGNDIVSYIAVILLAVFSSMHLEGVVYSFVYILTNKSRLIVLLSMISGYALMMLLVTEINVLLTGRVFQILAILLFLPVLYLSFELKKTVKDFSFKEKTDKLPLALLAGGLIIVGVIQFMTTFNNVVQQYRAVNELSSFKFYQIGQLLAVLFVIVMIIIFSVRIMNLFYVFIASSILGFFLLMYSKAGGIGFTDAGIVIIGFCDIGTVVAWMVTASISGRYKGIWVLLSFLVVFGVSSVSATYVGSFIIEMNPLMFYLSAGMIAVVSVALSIIFIPVIRNIPEDIIKKKSKLDFGGLRILSEHYNGTENQNGDSVQRQESEDLRFNLLTPREREVTSQLLEGYTAPQIAAILKIKTYTVKVHIRNIYQKLDIGSRPELFIKYGNSLNL